MQAVRHLQSTHDRREGTVLPGLLVMALAAIVGVFLLLGSTEAFSSYPYLYLFPWLLGLAILMVLPTGILYYQGKFSFADPLIFSTWSYLFPAFVLGGLFFAGGWSDPAFVALIQDAPSTMPFTIFIVGLGFAALSLGYFAPWGRKAGSYIGEKLPLFDYENRSFLLPGLALLALGSMNTAIAFLIGIFGYQKNNEINSYDGLIFLAASFWVEAAFILWLVVFRARKVTLFHVPVIALLIVTSLVRVMFAGNRGTIVQIFTIVVLAYILSGRRFKLGNAIFAGIVLTVGLFAGMIYGTSFRNVKGTEASQSLSQYTDNIAQTIDEVGKSDINRSISFGFTSLAERMDILSTLAVVVSNHEQLKPYEEAYGLDNNIWTDLTTFLIPRIIWKDKPYASDPRRYSELYFDYGESSFAITPFGDLLRNYGMVGVALGMFILGLILRFIYSALIEGQTATVWRIAIYFVLLTAISYEGFYGSIIPTLFKVGLTAVIGALIVCFLASRLSVSRTNNLRHV